MCVIGSFPSVVDNAMRFDAFHATTLKHETTGTNAGPLRLGSGW